MVGSSLKSCGQENLADSGKCDWDDGIRSGLDREYPDWKDPCETHMIPESFPHKANIDLKGQQAEELVYNLLQRLGTKNNEPMFVVHSFDFSEHIPGYSRKRSWVMGESDFIIVHKTHGPIFIQVKASDSGNKYIEAENQLRKDKITLENFLKKLLENKKISKKQASEVFKNYPGFVAMPNCTRDQSAMVRDNVLYQEDCSSLETFIKWWNDKISSAKHPTVTSTIFEFLVMRFVGSVMVSPCLRSQVNIDKTYQFLKFNTREQLKVLLDSSSQKWIIGPAGSGKTSLLLEKVTLLAQKILINSLEEKILVVCYNKPLSLMITNVFESSLRDLLQGNELSSVVDVKTFDKLLTGINGSFNVNDGEKGVLKALENLQLLTSSERPSYEHIFVDEGQDLYGAQWESLLKMLHKSSPNDPVAEDDDFEPRYFWVFYDSNQHLHLTKEQIAPHSESLRNSTRLHQVLRNTKNIFLQFKKYFKPIVIPSDPATPVGVYHGRDGLKIAWDGSAEELCVVKHLECLQKEGVQKSDICILVKDVAVRDSLMSNLARCGVVSQNAEKLWKGKDSNKVVVESIRRFKGLESKVVILYEPPFCHSSDNSKTRELLYTAVSRSACLLIVISTKEGCEALQSTEGLINVHREKSPIPKLGKKLFFPW